MRIFLFYLLVIIFLSLSLGVKAAPLATAQAYLDWSHLTIQTFDVTGNGAPSISWTSYYQWAEASADEDYQWNKRNSWDSLSVSASMAGAWAYATLNGTSMRAYSDPIEFGTEAWASASAERYGTFTVSGEGLVAIGVPYEIEVSLSSFAASASTDIWIELSNSEEWDSGRFSYSEVILEKEGDVDGLGTWTDSGWVWVTLYFEDGETGYFTASLDTSASSPVPLPGTFVLLGSALLGFSLGKKSFSKK